VKDTIEAGARARGISVAALRREASELQLMQQQRRQPAARAGAIRASATSRPGMVAIREPTNAGAAKTADLTPQLEAAFRRVGLSAEAARVAARGRSRRI
jgi:hypothetical protein